MTAPSRFKQADVTRALKAAVRAGMRPSGYKIDPSGAIVVLFATGSAAVQSINPWDAELAL
jgi:hypothetical protein